MEGSGLVGMTSQQMDLCFQSQREGQIQPASGEDLCNDTTADKLGGWGPGAFLLTARMQFTFVVLMGCLRFLHKVTAPGPKEKRKKGEMEGGKGKRDR